MIFEVTAVLGLIASCAAAFIAWLGYRMSASASDPVVSLGIDPVENRPGWWQLTLSVRNRSDTPLKAETLHIRTPHNVRAVGYHQLTARGDFNETILDPADATPRLSRAVPLQLAVAPIGVSSDQWVYGSSDHHHETIFLFAPSRRARRLSMTLILRSNSAVVRKTKIAVTRLLPPNPSAQADRNA